MSEAKDIWATARDIITRYCSTQDADLFLYSGEVTLYGSEMFIEFVEEKTKRRSNVSLFLSTYGGDIHRAYRMIRSLKSHYGSIRLLIGGPCKSAGTLIAIGSDVVAFGYRGELGPLDVQMSKQDEIVGVSSGLDSTQALGLLTQHAFKTFENYLYEITASSRGSISTKTASHIACELVTGLMNPIAAQLDPIGLGESQRALAIAKQYGSRLVKGDEKKEKALGRLVEEYSSHGFVIDQKEFKGLFDEGVESLTEEEHDIYKEFRFWLQFPQPKNKEVAVDLGKWLGGGSNASGTDGTGEDTGSNDDGGDEEEQAASAGESGSESPRGP